jgi:hypothetical protein
VGFILAKTTVVGSYVQRQAYVSEQGIDFFLACGSLGLVYPRMIQMWG